MRSVPNYLTFLRLALIPVFVYLMLDPSEFQLLLATSIFIVAVITDYCDGFIARRYSAISDFGKLLDPLADKILVMAALVMLVGQRGDSDGLPWIPAWMVVMVLAREIWVTGLRSLAALRGSVIAASSSGKLKSGLQMLAIVLLLLHDHVFVISGKAIPCKWLGHNLLFISLVISYWGAAEYSMQVLGSSLGSGTAAARSPEGGNSDQSPTP